MRKTDYKTFKLRLTRFPVANTNTPVASYVVNIELEIELNPKPEFYVSVYIAKTSFL